MTQALDGCPCVIFQLIASNDDDDDRPNCQDQVERNVDDNHSDEEKKILMVSITHTVIDVRTMMIKSLNTFVAYVAMSASWGSDNFTIRA